MIKVLAVASGGGHWKELLLLKDGFDIPDVNCIKYVTTIPGLPEDEGIKNYSIVKDANKTQKIGLLISFFQIIKIYVGYRPHVVVSTGAAPGILALMLGKLGGAKTIWIDSIANADKFSLSGEIAQRFADTFITQWEHLADGKTIHYHGSVL